MKYNIIYSNRKTVSINVRNAEVTVRAPKGADKKRILRFVNSHEAWIEKAVEKQKEFKAAEITDANEIKALKKEAREYLTQKTEYYSKIMGLSYGRISITSAKTRHGSCSSKGNISYSYRLMRYPEAAREYVVVHELAHLVELNHSNAFYKIVESVLPDYKERRSLLK